MDLFSQPFAFLSVYILTIDEWVKFPSFQCYMRADTIALPLYFRALSTIQLSISACLYPTVLLGLHVANWNESFPRSKSFSFQQAHLSLYVLPHSLRISFSVLSSRPTLSLAFPSFLIFQSVIKPWHVPLNNTARTQFFLSIPLTYSLVHTLIISQFHCCKLHLFGLHLSHTSSLTVQFQFSDNLLVAAPGGGKLG